MASPAQSSSSSRSGEVAVTLTLIPGLPDDIAAMILVSLPYSHRSRIRPTARAWYAFLSYASVAPLRRRLRLPPRHILCLFPSDPSVVRPFLFDPAAAAWAPLPTLPCSPFVYGLSNFATIALGHQLYVLGGSHFDARAYPLGLPLPSAAVHRLDLSVAFSPHLLSWTRLPDMLCPRGSFACASVEGTNGIIVAGGGSRHAMFPSSGTRLSSVEIFDTDSGVWASLKGLPRYRAGCIGFFLRRQLQRSKEEDELVLEEDEEDEEEFWVMGGYGDYLTLSGVVPAHVYYRDALVFGLRTGKWRSVGEMWEAEERQKLGKVVVMDDQDGEVMGVFMLDRNAIFRYQFDSNRWHKESSLRRKIVSEDSCGFVAMNGELCVLTKAAPSCDPSKPGWPSKKRMVLEIQAYDPLRKQWRIFTTNPPFDHPIDFKTAISCTIQL